MTAREILENKEVFTTQDIMTLCEVKRVTACKIMQAIRSVSDRLGIRGIVHKKDYLDYINRFGTQKKSSCESWKNNNYSCEQE